MYEILKKLLRSQAKSLWEEISIPLGIVSSVVAILAYIQIPASRNVILLLYGVAALIIVGLPIERSYRKKNGLDHVTYLGIYLDEAAKYLRQIKLAATYDQSDATVTDFVDDTKDALRGSLPFLKKKITVLKTRAEYPACLAQIGRSEAWVQKLDEQVKLILELGFID